MRSLTVKFTLAFVLVGLMGASLVALLIGQRTRSEFDRFLSERDQTEIVAALGAYYQQNGSWSGVGDLVASTPALRAVWHDLSLVDASGTVVLGAGRFHPGERVSQRMLMEGTLLEVGGQPVGVLVRAPDNRPGGG